MKKTQEFVHWRTETESLRSPSREKFSTTTLCARRIVKPQASPLMKVTIEIQSLEQKERDVTVQESGLCCGCDRFQVDIVECAVYLVKSHICVRVSWACKKQTTTSNRSTEAEVISLCIGLRIEGLPALTLWEIVIDVLEPLFSRATGDPSRHTKPEMSQITQESTDHVPPNAQQFNIRAHVFLIDDNEASKR